MPLCIARFNIGFEQCNYVDLGRKGKSEGCRISIMMLGARFMNIDLTHIGKLGSLVFRVRDFSDP